MLSTLSQRWLTSTSMHSLSFLQVAAMVSVVPNSKYHSLFFILTRKTKKRDRSRTHEGTIGILTSRIFVVVDIVKLSAALSHVNRLSLQLGVMWPSRPKWPKSNLKRHESNYSVHFSSKLCAHSVLSDHIHGDTVHTTLPKVGCGLTHCRWTP